MTAAPGRDALEPCPFCGYAAMKSGNPSDKREPAINIHCSDCNVEGGWFYGADCVDRATKHWNTRLAANPPSAPDAMPMREALIDAQDGLRALVAWVGATRNGVLDSEDRVSFEDDLKIALRAREAVDTALSAPVPPADEGWQDISNAPRDGTRILATGGGLGNEIEIVTYNERIGCWDAPNDTLDDRDDEPQGYNRPTLWQPLPARLSATGEPPPDKSYLPFWGTSEP